MVKRMNETIACDSRREKHIDLNDAIKNLDSVNAHIDELINRLKGPVPGNCLEDPKETAPSFIDVLDRSPAAIREKAQVAHEKLEELTHLLF